MRDAKMVEFVFPIPLTKRILVAAHLASLANIVNKVKKTGIYLWKKPGCSFFKTIKFHFYFRLKAHFET